MAQISKFTFETDFADPNAGRAKPKDQPEIEVPTFSEEELLSAREHGYEAGIAAGQAQALAGIERSLGEVVAKIDLQLREIAEQMTSQKALAAEDVAILAGAIATKVSGIKSDQERLDLLQGMITDCMAKLYQAPEVTARVAPDIDADLRSVLAMSDLTITVNVVPDPALTGTDCRLTWHGGGAERIEARIWQDVEALLERHVAGTAAAGVEPEPAATDVPAAPQSAAAAAPEDVTAAPPDDALNPADYLTDSSAGAPDIDALLEPDGGETPRTAPGDQDG